MPKYGLAVTGFVHPEKLLTNAGAKPGDALLLTKALGVGVMLTAQKVGMASREGMERVFAQMTELNQAARDCMLRYQVHACTDVTGFGLLGHGLEMAQASEAALELRVDGIALPQEAVELARMGLLPEGMYRNRHFAEAWVDPGEVSLAKQDLLYDPQTSGGLLVAVSPEDSRALLSDLEGQVSCIQEIGRVTEYKGGPRILLK